MLVQIRDGLMLKQQIVLRDPMAIAEKNESLEVKAPREERSVYL